MDKPFAALGVQETKKVIYLIKETINHVQGMIVITHNIDHILKIVDRAIVLLNGKRVGELDFSNAETRNEELHHKIVSLIIGAFEN